MTPFFPSEVDTERPQNGRAVVKHPGYRLTDWTLFTSSLTIEEKLVLGVTLALPNRDPSLRLLEALLPINKTAIREAQQRLDAREGFIYQRPPRRLVQPDGHKNPVHAHSNRLVRVPPNTEPNRRDGTETTSIHISGRLAAALPRKGGKRNGKTIPLIVMAWAREQILTGGILVTDEAIGARLGLSTHQVEHIRDELRRNGLVTTKRNGYFKINALYRGSEERHPDRRKERIELHVLDLTPPLRYLGTQRQRQAVIDYASRLPEPTVYEAAGDVRSAENQTDPNVAVDGTRLIEKLALLDLAHRAALKAEIPTPDPTLTPTPDPDSLPHSSLTGTSSSCALTRADEMTKDVLPQGEGTITGLLRNSSPDSAAHAPSARAGDDSKERRPAWMPDSGASVARRSWEGPNKNTIFYFADDSTHDRIEEMHDYLVGKYDSDEAFGAIRQAVLGGGKPEPDGRVILRRLRNKWGDPYTPLTRTPTKPRHPDLDADHPQSTSLSDGLDDLLVSLGLDDHTA